MDLPAHFFYIYIQLTLSLSLSSLCLVGILGKFYVKGERIVCLTRKCFVYVLIFGCFRQES